MPVERGMTMADGGGHVLHFAWTSTSSSLLSGRKKKMGYESLKSGGRAWTGFFCGMELVPGRRDKLRCVYYAITILSTLA